MGRGRRQKSSRGRGAGDEQPDGYQDGWGDDERGTREWLGEDDEPGWLDDPEDAPAAEPPPRSRSAAWDAPAPAWPSAWDDDSASGGTPPGDPRDTGTPPGDPRDTGVPDGGTYRLPAPATGDVFTPPARQAASGPFPAAGGDVFDPAPGEPPAARRPGEDDLLAARRRAGDDPTAVLGRSGNDPLSSPGFPDPLTGVPDAAFPAGSGSPGGSGSAEDPPFPASGADDLFAPRGRAGADPYPAAGRAGAGPAPGGDDVFAAPRRETGTYIMPEPAAGPAFPPPADRRPGPEAPGAFLGDHPAAVDRPGSPAGDLWPDAATGVLAAVEQPGRPAAPPAPGAPAHDRTPGASGHLAGDPVPAGVPDGHESEWAPGGPAAFAGDRDPGRPESGDGDGDDGLVRVGDGPGYLPADRGAPAGDLTSFALRDRRRRRGGDAEAGEPGDAPPGRGRRRGAGAADRPGGRNGRRLAMFSALAVAVAVASVVVGVKLSSGLRLDEDKCPSGQDCVAIAEGRPSAGAVPTPAETGSADPGESATPTRTRGADRTATARPSRRPAPTATARPTRPRVSATPRPSRSTRPPADDPDLLDPPRDRPEPSSSPDATPNDPDISPGRVAVGFAVAESSPDGYTGRLTITNTGPVLAGWGLRVEVGGDVIDVTGANWTQDGAELALTSETSLAPGERAVVTFTADGDSAPPGGCELDGGTCEVDMGSLVAPEGETQAAG
ncbi:hypothetical protein Sru01_14950 [Sphaerisporangium rufum]|uniref:CBM2 domain-containing protein n=1 Tax=Sphaerisporangium rufum TaxID=1381558 RepID=A0A919V0B2_9ACTN|nr:hypothetical protein [Sphaerisporangium rufum]GII76513.1 hypothetical protein Sru01_14950 [Sphaerisporangium rufum]